MYTHCLLDSSPSLIPKNEALSALQAQLSRVKSEAAGTREKLEASSRRQIRLELELGNCKEELATFKADWDANYAGRSDTLK